MGEKKKKKNPLALRRVVFISRGERRRLGGPAIGAASCGRHGRNSLRSFSVICAFGEKMQSRKSVDVWRAGADTSLVAVRERTMNKFSCVPRRLPSITKHKVSMLRPVCMEHQITLQQMSWAGSNRGRGHGRARKGEDGLLISQNHVPGVPNAVQPTWAATAFGSQPKV